MGVLDYFRSTNKNSATTAKERLQIIIARERAGRSGPDFLPMLEEELLAVVQKYVPIKKEQVKVTLEREDDCEVLELNITLADPVL